MGIVDCENEKGEEKWMLLEPEDRRIKPVDSQIYHKLSGPWWVAFNQDDFTNNLLWEEFQSRKTDNCSNKRHRDTHTRRVNKISSEPFSEFTSQLVFPFKLCCFCSFLFFFLFFSAMFSHILFALAVHNFPLHTNVHLTTTRKEHLHLFMTVKPDYDALSLNLN